MVSTTLTAIAAGQPTSSSSNYHHHHQSLNATAVASSTANSNSNYQKAQQQQQQQHQRQQQPQLQHHSSSSTSSSALTTNSYYGYNVYALKSNDELHTVNLPPTNSCAESTEVYKNLNRNVDIDVDADADGVGDGDVNRDQNEEKEGDGDIGVDGDGDNRNPSHQYQQRPSTALRYDRGIQSAKEETTTHNISGESELQTAKAQCNEIVTLSQALLSSSSPLNDQISLLFPKCRPKHVTSNGNTNNSNSNTNSESADIEILSNDSSKVEQLNGDSTSSPTQSHPRTFKTESFKSPSTKSQANRNYYRSVNIITQSPPPPSTSSVSSESLSSVTPRISTNPFLCSADDNDSPKLNEEREKSFQEDLPVPTYRTFYYHTSTAGNNIQPDQYKTHNQQRISLDEEDRSYEMPRKRTNYNSTMHAAQISAQPHTYTSHMSQTSMMAADNQRHHQLRQQQQQQQQQQQFHQKIHQQNSNGTMGEFIQSNVQSNQNPFIRDNYWEPTTRHNITPSNTVLNSPETELPPSMYSTATSSSLRRAYHQQAFSNSNSNENGISRIQQQQQHQQQQARLTRSPINMQDSMPITFNESTKTTDHHFTDQSLMKSCSEGNTPLVSHYMGHGTRANANGVGGGSSSGVGVIKEHTREQDARDKRDVGQFQQPTQTQTQTQAQTQTPTQSQSQTQTQIQAQAQHQLQHHPHQLRQQYQTTRSMTEGRLSMISNGEVVVFDDITESWQNLKVTTDTNAPRLSPITQNGIMATSSAKVIQQNTMTVMDINGEGNGKTTMKVEDTSIPCREHKKHTEKINMNTTMDARHGIIEYEGSPRRIGHAGNTSEDERIPIGSIQMQPNLTRPSSTNYNNVSSSFNSNSPQYPARPGFPQRIMSPPRESTPPTSVPNYGSNVKPPTQHFTAEYSAQPQQSPTDNNAEDTSNDVSEIGTISDLTTPEVISAAAALGTPNQDSIQTTITTPTGQTSTMATTTTPNTGTSALTIPTKSSTFDYLYEFSETRKVLEEFFKCPSNDEKPIEDSSDIDSVDIQYEFHSNFDRDDEDHPIDIEDDDDDGDGDDDDDVDDDDDEEEENGQPEAENDDNLQMKNQNQTQNNFYHHRQQQQQQQQDLQQQPAIQSLPRYPYIQQQQQQQQQQPTQLQQDSSQKSYNHGYVNHRRRFTGSPLMRDFDFFLDSASRSSGEQNDQQDGINHNQQQDGRNNYRYSPETTDYDSNCGDLDSLSGDMNGGVSTSCSNYAKYYASSMPVLEDGLSSGHTSDTENNNNNNFNNNLQQQQQQQSNTGIHHTPIGGGISVLMDMKRVSTNNSINSMNNVTASTTDVIQPGEKFNSISSNNLHDGGHQGKLESPVSSTGIGILDDQVRDSGRGTNRENHLRNNQDRELLGQSPTNIGSSNKVFKNIDPDLDALYSINVFHRTDVVQMTPPPPAPAPHRKPNITTTDADLNPGITFTEIRSGTSTTSPTPTTSIASAISSTLNRNRNTAPSNCLSLQQSSQLHSSTRTYQPQPPPIPERTIQRSPSPVLNSPVWLPRHLDNSANKNLLETSSDNHSKNQSADEDDIDTDLETDRLLGHQRLDDQGYYDENKSWERNKPRSLLSKISPKQQLPSTKTRNGYNALLSSTPEIPPPIPPKNSSNKLLDISGSMSSPEHSDKSPIKTLDVQECIVTMGSPGGSNGSNGSNGTNGSGCINGNIKKEIENINTTNGITNNGHQNTNGSNSSASGNESVSNVGSNHASGEKKVKKSKNKEGGAVLIEGVLFRAKYLGSTQLVCEGQPTKSTRMMQAEEAVSRIKAPDSDVQPSTEVDLFISTEKIMVLNTDLKEIMMDHALRTISYIADIGDLVVLMARRRFVPQDIDDAPKPNRTPKMICHVFESDEAQFIAQSIGQAFQVAYMEFLKANGIEDHSFVKEMDYQEVLNSQEIFGDELEIFAKKELQKEVVVPKAKGEILGVVIVESGWGSMLPTVVIANLMSSGAAARCGQLNIGDQLIAINGLSLVGLPLSTCQNYIKNTKNQTVVKFTVVPCPPVVEVKIKRPNTKYQLGFSVQNGVICSLLRGGIAERGGVRVGHRIIEINNQSVVAVPHEKIVNLLATSVGEILMKTMPTSMFRLLTGQETPIYI